MNTNQQFHKVVTANCGTSGFTSDWFSIGSKSHENKEEECIYAEKNIQRAHARTHAQSYFVRHAAALELEFRNFLFF